MTTLVADKYRLDGVIGSGAFGTVYKAVHTGLDRTFAVKLLEIPDELRGREEQIRGRFMREAKILGRLEHPNIVQVFDFGEHAGEPYLVMEFLNGRTLYRRLKQDGGVSEEEIYRITSQILSGLVHAHGLGLMHRDLKPANVMLVGNPTAEEDVKLLDFGVATAFRDDALGGDGRFNVTAAGHFVGTAQYAAPEQFMGEADARSDVYGVGLLMWEMVTGKPAVSAADVGKSARRHLSKEAWVLPESCQVSDELRAVVERALRKKPGERYADSKAMLEELEYLGRASTSDRRLGAMMSEAEFSEQAGDVLAGRYRLEEMIGAGGFSRVFRAEHVEMERQVAVKLLDLEGAVAQAGGTTAVDLEKRFGREAKMCSQLSHPNTITVYDFGVDAGGRWYIVMEYVEGDNLYAAIRTQGRFEPERVARVVRDILGSLSEAHHLGVLHRDLKPGNIMLTHDYQGQEVAKVLDFGILSTIHGVGEGVLTGKFKQMRATQLGTFVGTPQYAAPEQFLGEELTPATDIYAVGLVMWEMLCGEAALETEVFGKCLQTHLDADPWRLPDDVDVPEGLAEILYGALEKDQDTRYRAANDMVADLDRWLSGDRGEFEPAGDDELEEEWDPKFEYRSTDGVILDPNLSDEDVPELLRPPLPGGVTRRRENPAKSETPARGESSPDAERDGRSPETDRAERRRRSGREARDARRRKEDARNERAERAMRERREKARASEEKLELDYDRVRQTSPSRDRIVRPSVHNDARRRALPWSWIAAGAGLILVAIVAYGAVFGADDEPQVDLTKEEPMYLDLDEPKPTPDETARNRFSAAGIMRALEAGGWSVRRTGEMNALANVHQQGYRLSRSGTDVEIELVTTKSTSIAQQMHDDTRPPIQSVVFDNKLVRVFPPGGRESLDAEGVVALLRKYRDIVLETSNGAGSKTGEER